MNHIERLIQLLLNAEAHSATKYISPTYIIRATRRIYGGKIIRRGNIEIEVTIGRPNYAERKFIKDCLKAGERFPVRKAQLKPLPKRGRKN